MTAIAGLWQFDGRPDVADRCARVLRSQELYGPDAVGQWSGEGVALGRRLMRLLPEDVHDRQPLIGAGGRLVLVADVRLDNRDELAADLRISAADVRNQCDAAVLLAAFERWGGACVERLVGDFAFAVWDQANRRLTLARDHLGQRPLHYHRGKDFFAFASMPKGLHALPDVPYAPDEQCAAEYLVFLAERGSQSFFSGIERVEPGHVAVATPEGLTTRRYWEPRRTTLKLNSADEYAEALRQQVDQAVRARLRGTGDIGAHLSGGLDSSTVAATAARLLRPTGRQVIAFTAVPRDGYDGPTPRNRINDEGPQAAATVAMHPNMEHVLIRSEGRTPLDDLDRLHHLCDRPLMNLCNTCWASAIHDAARERKLSVMLTGQVGNMSLSYAGLELLPELMRSGRWLQWWRTAHALVSQGRMRWRGVMSKTIGPWLPPQVWRQLNRIYNGSVLDITKFAALHPSRLNELDLPRSAPARHLDLAFRPWKDSFDLRLWVLSQIDLGTYYKGMLGGWRVDERDPTADVRLIEFCLAVPTEQFLRDGTQRALARRAFADRLPPQVLQESRRGYQGADWHEQLTAARDRLATEVEALDACPPAARTLDVARMRTLVANWPADGWERDEIRVPYRLALLRGISTGHFLRRASGGNR